MWFTGRTEIQQICAIRLSNTIRRYQRLKSSSVMIIQLSSSYPSYIHIKLLYLLILVETLPHPPSCALRQWPQQWWCSLCYTGGQWELSQLLLGHWAAGRTHHLPQDNRSQWWCWSSQELGLNYSTAMLPSQLWHLWHGQWPQWEWVGLRWQWHKSKYIAINRAIIKRQLGLQK